ncbi:hypothetical protein SOP94_11285, partial [Peribacillus frigoritolerans]|uniref:hypothetical protein n=1 Tax=Peribacillus frigoritolerans TaxID=450367 RepID=UPI002B24EEFC
TISLKKEVPADWNVRYETPAGKAWPSETPRTPRRLPGPPAESECLEWKSLQIPTFGNPLPFRRLSAKPLHRKRRGVLATQLFGRSPANFFHPLRITVKKHQGSPILKFGSG